MVNKIYKNYTIGSILKNTIITLFFYFFNQYRLRVINSQSPTSNIVRALYFETDNLVNYYVNSIIVI